MEKGKDVQAPRVFYGWWIVGASLICMTGLSFDATGSYTLALGSFFFLVLAASGFMLPLRALADGREELTVGPLPSRHVKFE